MAYIILILSNFLIICGLLIFFLGALNFLKSKNIFASIKFVTIANIYGFSFLLFGFFLKNYQSQNNFWQNLPKIIILLAVNLIIAVILSQIFNKRAFLNKKNLKDLRICKTGL